MSSKEIAKATGLTPHTVDTYVKASMSRLGAANRRDAARTLAAWELSQQTGSQSSTLAAAPEPADDPTRTDGTGWPHWLRLPPVGGGYSDLTWTQKSYQMLLVAVVAAAVVIALSLALAGLLQTFS